MQNVFSYNFSFHLYLNLAGVCKNSIGEMEGNGNVEFAEPEGGEGVKDTGVIFFFILGCIVGVGVVLLRRTYGL